MRTCKVLLNFEVWLTLMLACIEDKKKDGREVKECLIRSASVKRAIDKQLQMNSKALFGVTLDQDQWHQESSSEAGPNLSH